MDTIDFNTADTALIVWEEWITRECSDNLPQHLEDFRGGSGVAVTREAIIKLAPKVDDLWEKLQADEYLMDGIAYDFEFVPALFENELIEQGCSQELQLKPEAYELMSYWRDREQARMEGKKVPEWISAKTFRVAVGRSPIQDDLIRSNCPHTGLGHGSCGWNDEQDCPQFMARVDA